MELLHENLRLAKYVALRVVVTLLLACLIACSEAEHTSSTQVTARIYLADEVRERMSQLRVRSYQSGRAGFVLRNERVLSIAELEAVVDIDFTPRDREPQGTTLVVADALADDGGVLVAARATFAFVQGEQRMFELWLYRCGGMEFFNLCSPPDCADETCLTCSRDRCAATPLYTKPQLVSFDPSVAADPDRRPPGTATDAAVGNGPDPRADAGTVSGGDQDAGACASSAACDASEPSEPEAEAGSAFDASTSESDAAAMDADTSEVDTGAPSDAAADAGNDAGEPPFSCAQSSAWTSVRTNGTIPAGARMLAQHTTSAGTLGQYLCRVLTPDGVTLAPGKVSGSASNPSRFDYGCYGTFYGPVSGMPGTEAWQSFGVDSLGAQFQVLTPPSECQLDWVMVSAGEALPARALAVGNTGGANASPIYACRITVQDTMTTGTHIGRVGNALGELCHVQYYQQAPFARAQFEVLVQTRP
jgi:hypothetical protein